MSEILCQLPEHIANYPCVVFIADGDPAIETLLQLFEGCNGRKEYKKEKGDRRERRFGLAGKMGDWLLSLSKTIGANPLLYVGDNGASVPIYISEGVPIEGDTKAKPLSKWEAKVPKTVVQRIYIKLTGHGIPAAGPTAPPPSALAAEQLPPLPPPAPPVTAAEAGEEQVEILYAAGCAHLAKGRPIMPIGNGKIPSNNYGGNQKKWQLRKCDKKWLRSGLDHTKEPRICARFGPELGMNDFEMDDDRQIAAYNHLWRDVVEPATCTFMSKQGPHKQFKYDPRLDVLHGIYTYVLPGGDRKKDHVKIRIGGLRDGLRKGAQSVIPPSKNRHWLPGQSWDDMEPAQLPEEIVKRLLEDAGFTYSPPGDTTTDLESVGSAGSAGKTDLSKVHQRPAPPEETNIVHTVNTAFKTTISTECTTSTIFGGTVEDAIRLTMPTAVGQRSDCIWDFRRYVMLIPEFANTDVAEHKPLMRQWHAAALATGNIRTLEFDASWDDYVQAFKNAKWAFGQGKFDQLYNQAMMSFPAICEDYDDMVTRRLVAFCRFLQLDAGREQPFFLDCGNGARVMGMSTWWIWKRLYMLEADHVIVLHEKGGRGLAPVTIKLKNGKERETTRRCSTWWYRHENLADPIKVAAAVEARAKAQAQAKAEAAA